MSEGTHKVDKVTKLTDQKWLNLFDAEYTTASGKKGNWVFASRKENPQAGPIQADAVVVIPIHKKFNPYPQVDDYVEVIGGEDKSIIGKKGVITKQINNNSPYWVSVEFYADGFASLDEALAAGPCQANLRREEVKKLDNNNYEMSLVVTKEYRFPLADYEFGFPAGLYDHNESAEEVARRELKEETGLDLTKILYIGPPTVSSAGLSDESVVYVVCECEGTVSRDGNQDVEDIHTELMDLDQLRALRNSNVKIAAKALPFFFVFEAMGEIVWPKERV